MSPILVAQGKRMNHVFGRVVVNLQVHRVGILD
jgi:hypothetical protein